MNVLFLTNYYGLHGSSIDLLTYAKRLRESSHGVYFLGVEGVLTEQFALVSSGIHVQKKRDSAPSMRQVGLILRLMAGWRIDVVVGVGKFISLEGQAASLLCRARPPLSIMNFSPRRSHWPRHPKWHIPAVGYLAVNSRYYRETTVSQYRWPEERISLLSARYEIPDELPKVISARATKRRVLLVRRLDHPKYKGVLKSLEQMCGWGIRGGWSIEIAGGGTHEGVVRDSVRSMRQEHPDFEVRILGRVGNAASLMGGADIVVGSERVVVEGVAQGCLVLLANDDGLVDIVTPDNIATHAHDNFFGFGSKPLTPGEIEDRLAAILSSDERIHATTSGTFHYVKEHLDVRIGIRTLEQLLAKSAAQRLGAGRTVSSLAKVAASWIGVYRYRLTDRLRGAR